MIPQEIIELKAVQMAERILRGVRQDNNANHHFGMAAILGPRPAYCTRCFKSVPTELSLQLTAIQADNPHLYTGYWSAKSRRGGEPPLLSTNPSDYRWQCHACNEAQSSLFAFWVARGGAT